MPMEGSYQLMYHGPETTEEVLKEKNHIYYIICEKGVLSSKVVRTLSYFGYNLVQVKY